MSSFSAALQRAAAQNRRQRGLFDTAGIKNGNNKAAALQPRALGSGGGGDPASLKATQRARMVLGNISNNGIVISVSDGDGPAPPAAAKPRPGAARGQRMSAPSQTAAGQKEARLLSEIKQVEALLRRTGASMPDGGAKFEARLTELRTTLDAARASAADAAAMRAPAAADSVALPPGWVKQTSKSTGKVYYLHTQTKQSQWQRPQAPQEQRPAKQDARYSLPLPPIPPSSEDGGGGGGGTTPALPRRQAGAGAAQMLSLDDVARLPHEKHKRGGRRARGHDGAVYINGRSNE